MDAVVHHGDVRDDLPKSKGRIDALDVSLGVRERRSDLE